MIRNSLNGRGKKSAGVTVELMLAITLAIVVLFFILNIFGDNLKTMVTSSQMSNVWDNEHKTTYSTQKYDPTSVNVQVLAEQGNTLEWYIEQATEQINKYKDTPPATLAEVEDLAKWATIARITKQTNILPVELETKFYKAYGISIDNLYTYATQIKPNPSTSIITNAGTNTNEYFTYDNSIGKQDLNSAAAQLNYVKSVYDAEYQR